MSKEACTELARRVGIDPEDVIESWIERAAIREFEGGQSRADADRDALEELRHAYEVVELAGQPRRGPRSSAAQSAAMIATTPKKSES